MMENKIEVGALFQWHGAPNVYEVTAIGRDNALILSKTSGDEFSQSLEHLADPSICKRIDW